MSNINEAALQLRNSSKTKTTCSPVRNLIGATDIESAYKVQEINIAERINRGAKPVGSKVGLTSFAVQKQLGVDQPDFGVLLDDMVVEQGGTVDYNLLMQPKVEAEVAFVLKSVPMFPDPIMAHFTFPIISYLNRAKINRHIT